MVMGEIIIRMVDLPTRVNGVTVVDENGDYNIYINSKLPSDTLIRVCDHEIAHVIKNHHYDYRLIEAVETEARDESTTVGPSVKNIISDIH